MTSLVSILLIIALAAVAYALVRGVITMAQGKDVSGEVQQGLMQKRVLYQGIAVVIVILILFMAGGGRS
jgi:succinate dehydrogenase/fumarate reductase cytochrome b subunit